MREAITGGVAITNGLDFLGALVVCGLGAWCVWNILRDLFNETFNDKV